MQEMATAAVIVVTPAQRAKWTLQLGRVGP